MKTRYVENDKGIELLLETTANSLSIISSRGQLTIPQPVRELCHISRGTVVAFEPQKEGVLLRPLKVVAENLYTEEEWKKIEKLRKTKGVRFTKTEKTIEHIDNL